MESHTYGADSQQDALLMSWTTCLQSSDDPSPDMLVNKNDLWLNMKRLTDAARLQTARLMLRCTFVFVSPLRLSKKPGDNKAKKSKQVSQKYTASRLHEKGVLIAIEDLQPNQSVLLSLNQASTSVVSNRSRYSRQYILKFNCHCHLWKPITGNFLSLSGF